MYPNIDVNVTITDVKKMLVHYKRRYKIQNVSDKPSHKVLHGIATDVDKKC